MADPAKPDAKPDADDEKKQRDKVEQLLARTPTVGSGAIDVDGRRLAYTVRAAFVPVAATGIGADRGDPHAAVFTIAYSVEPAGAAPRPVCFAFNGGPGSASVWLHLGAVGPKRVVMLSSGEMPAPPFRLVDNQHTWLDQTDLVFIDPVGTGYSRAAKPELGKKFWNLRGDIESVGEFIRMYLTRYTRWTSPLFLVGESYGTTRAAGLSGYLINRGVAFNAIVLVSSILNFQTADFAKGNDLPYILYLPTYAATAWYHKKLAPDLQRDLRKTLKEVEAWSETGYAEALAKGDRLTPAERQAAIDRLARYTGLDKRYIDNSDLRVSIMRFTKELLRDQKRTVGRLDSRFKGFDESAAAAVPEFDPSLSAIRPPYTSTFNNYIRGELGYKTDLEYYILGEGIEAPWEWGPSSSREGFPDTSDDLRSAVSKNPYMKLYVASGYFDLATPYFATEYTLTHLGLDPSLRANIRTGEYEAGHMMYIDTKSLEKLKRDVAGFLESALK
jgi:carboxypeptidase C (cathepsin A)